MSTVTPEAVVISRSGRVRKKSAKLMEMEEIETTEKQGEKRSAPSTTPRRVLKNKPVKLKMTIGGAPICEVIEDGEIPIAECADVFIEEPQLEMDVEEPPPQLPPITLKLSASKGTSQLGPTTIKSFEVVTDKRPSSRSSCEQETPKVTGRKRKITATYDDEVLDDVSPEINSSGGKASKKSKKLSGEKSKKPAITGYTLWTKENRVKIQQENPEMDFPAVSRRLGEIWRSVSNNEKLHWKVKAQKLAGKMSSTGPVTPEPPLAPALSIPPAVRQPSPKQKAQLSPAPQLTELTNSVENKMKNIPMTVATHLRVLGESMSSIGHKLSQSDSQNLANPLSDLLDSFLCSLNSLMFLTCVDPKLNGCPVSTHLRAMENISYIMPGV